MERAQKIYTLIFPVYQGKSKQRKYQNNSDITVLPPRSHISESGFEIMGRCILLEQILTTRQSLNKLPSPSYTFIEKRALLHCLHSDTTQLLLENFLTLFGLLKLQHIYSKILSYDLREMMRFMKL